VSRHRPSIPSRRRFFLGCEGGSERSYGALLRRLAEFAGLHVHLDLHDLRGGDPLAVIEAACRKAKERARNRGAFVGQAVLVDADRLGQTPDRDAQINPLAHAERILVVWQRPCHEALLLHHLPGCQTLMPADRSAANAALCRCWPEYRKPMSAVRLTARIGLAEVRAAARVEGELSSLLALLGFPP
jgi:hypothetical protein